MTTWITACEQTQTPYPQKAAPGQPYYGCQPGNMRSIEIEETVPPLDPALLAQAFAVGWTPVVFFYLVARGVGTVVNMVNRR